MNIQVQKQYLPPVIIDWLTRLNDTNTPRHVRDNTYLMLDNLLSVVQQELISYKTSKDNYSNRQKKDGRK